MTVRGEKLTGVVSNRLDPRSNSAACAAGNLVLRKAAICDHFAVSVPFQVRCSLSFLLHFGLTLVIEKTMLPAKAKEELQRRFPALSGEVWRYKRRFPRLIVYSYAETAGLTRLPRPGTSMVTTSPGASAASWVTMMPVPVSSTVAAGMELPR